MYVKPSELCRSSLQNVHWKMHLVTLVFSSNSPHWNVKLSQKSLECRNGAAVTEALGHTFKEDIDFDMTTLEKGWWQI